MPYTYPVAPHPLFIAILLSIVPLILFLILMVHKAGRRRDKGFLRIWEPLLRLYGGRVYKAILLASLLIVSGVLAGAFLTSVSVGEDGVLTVFVPLSFEHVKVRRGEILEAFIVEDFMRAGRLRPVLRILGAQWDRYCVGWLVLANGDSALFATSSGRAVYVRVAQGYYLVLSPSEFDEFLEIFRRYIVAEMGRRP